MDHTEEIKYTIEERNIILIKYCTQQLVDKLKDPLNQGGSERISYYYHREGESEISDHSNTVILEVSKDRHDEVTLRIGVCRVGTDRMTSNYLFDAGKTQEEICAWLSNTDVCVPYILKCEKNLSESVDEYWD